MSKNEIVVIEKNSMIRWRMWFWQIAIAALGPAVLWASPFGPARDLSTAAKLLVFGYPAWLVLSIIWLLPGIALVRKLEWRSKWWVVPCTAVLVQLSIGAVRNWPPTRWGAPVVISILAVPGRENSAGELPSSGAAFGISFESWHGYLYSLWAYCFIALVAALTLLLVQAASRGAPTAVGSDTRRSSR